MPELKSSKDVSWSKVIWSVLTIVIVVGLISGVLFWYFYVRQPEEATTVTTTKQSTTSAKKATTSAQKDVTADWKTYKNEQVKFTVKYPPDWTVGPAVNTTTPERSVGFKGKQGSVEIEWSDSYGSGGCTDVVDVKLKSKTLKNFCHYVKDSGTEGWSGVYGRATGTFPIVYGGFEVSAPKETNNEFILNIVDSLTFY